MQGEKSIDRLYVLHLQTKNSYKIKTEFDLRIT